MVGTWLDALRERLVIFGGIASMPMRLVIIVAFVFLLVFVWFCRFLLMLCCFRGGGIGGNINVHADAACDVRLCFSYCAFLLSWRRRVGEGGWGGDASVHGDTVCDIRLRFSSYLILLSGGGGGEGGC